MYFLVQERANIEKEYAKMLKTWAGKWNKHIEAGQSSIILLCVQEILTHFIL